MELKLLLLVAVLCVALETEGAYIRKRDPKNLAEQERAPSPTPPSKVYERDNENPSHHQTKTGPSLDKKANGPLKQRAEQESAPSPTPPFEVYERDGQRLIDDVIISKDSFLEDSGPEKRGVILSESKRWPSTNENGKRVVKIPYIVQNGLSADLVESIARAVSEYADKTCIRWVPRNDEKDYIKIVSGSGCVSVLGDIGGEQQLILGSGCQYKGKVLHEMMHVLGFFHEQNREDRDQYVTIHDNQIKDGFGANFAKFASKIVTPYDLHSLLHYYPLAFAKSSSPTITAKNNPNMVLGNKNDFSKFDLKKINTIYSCSEAGEDYEDYEVTVVTASGWIPAGEGTDAHVYFQLIGINQKKSGETDVASGGSTDDFERGANQHFIVTMKYVGPFNHLSVRLVKHGSYDDWKISKIVVKDPRTGEYKTFTYSDWLKPDHIYNL